MPNPSQKLQISVSRCDFLQRRHRKCNCCAGEDRLVIRVKEIMTRTQEGRSPLPATFSVNGGVWGPDDSVTFPDDFIEVRMEDGLRLRFEVLYERHQDWRPLGFAEIGVLDLRRKPSWRLLLCEPDLENAVYGTKIGSASGGSEIKEPAARHPAFLHMHTEAIIESGMLDNGMQFYTDLGPNPTRVQRPRQEHGRKRVLILTRGTRGDVQPFAALARGLVLHKNCEVTIVTELCWKQLVLDTKADLPPGTLHFRPSGGNTMKQTQSKMALMALRLGQHMDTIQALCLSKTEQNFFASEGCFYYWAWEEQPDFIVFAFTVTHVAMIISEALKIPIVGFFLQPAHELQQRISPATVRDQLLGPIRQVIDSEGFNAILQQVMEMIPDSGPTINALRKSRGLSPLPRGVHDEFQQYSELTRQGVPQIVPISSLVLGQHAETIKANGMTPTDFIFLRRDADQLDEEVDKFIQDAKSRDCQVVLMTFSSMPVGERKMLMAAVAVCDSCYVESENGKSRHRPAFIVMVSGQDFDPPPPGLQEKVKRLSEERRLLVVRRGIAFGALFPRIDAIVLHGGLGVTSEALLAGVPMVTSGILLLDQRYWAARVAELGCGPPGVGIDDLLLNGVDEDSDEVCEEIQAVHLLRKALDQRQGPGPDGKLSWRQKAKEIQMQLQEASAAHSMDGVLLNADTVYAKGVQAAAISDAYSRDRSCLRSCARQVCCCKRCCENLVHWLVCTQFANCAYQQLKCTRWCLRFTLRCCCCRRRSNQPLLEQDVSSFDRSSPHSSASQP